ncbi:MAG: PIN domain-containing protein [Actinobacteria bacterium]|nr:PIN domain-containing protein [Actinomycetota bacterium]
MGPRNPQDGEHCLTTYLLDTTVLIGHLRGLEEVTRFILDLLTEGHTLGTSCVNIAELHHGARPHERKDVQVLVDRLEFLETTPEASTRAGKYQARLRGEGTTLHTADALVAGTARAHGAILVTDNEADFPMRDLRVVRPLL